MKHLFHYFFLSLFILSSQLVTAQTQFSCGVSDGNLPTSTIQLMGQAQRLLSQQRARSAASPRRICRIAVDIDSDTYITFEKDTNLIRSTVLKQVKAASQIFERDINTRLTVVRIHIWKDTDPDPYRGVSGIFQLIDILTNTWQKNFKDIPYDKVTYLFTKNVVGAGGVGNLSGINSVSPLSSAIVMAHEFGHNFGSAHTHSCNWAGGPIDYCAAIEGNCYDKSLETENGTIMSYCDRPPYRFHPLCQAVMIDHAEKNLASLTALPNRVPVLPAQQTLTTSRFLYWEGLPQAERYDLEVSRTADFAQSVFTDTTAVNGYDLNSLGPDQSYFIRVRAVNRFGASGWSAACQILLNGSDKAIAVPVLLSPTPDQRFVKLGEQVFSVQPVPGATGYEVQITDGNYDPGMIGGGRTTYPQSSFKVPASQLAIGMWRVRAVVGNQKGPWSAMGRFFTETLAYRLSFPNNPVSTITPFNYSPLRSDLTMRVSVATDTSFSTPVYQKTVPPGTITGQVTGLLRELKPGMTYYLKIEEINTGTTPELPIGVIQRLNRTFTTAAGTLPAQWSFINNDTQPVPMNYIIGLNATPDALWVGYENSGIARIDVDSGRVSMFDRNRTNGIIGGASLQVNGSKPGEVWSSNEVSAWGGQPFVAARQVGKLTPSGELTNVIRFRPGNNYPSLISGSSGLFSGNRGLYKVNADTLAVFYQVPPDRTSVIYKLIRPGIVWMSQYNPAINATELVELNLITKVTRTFSYQTTSQLGRYFGDMAVDGLGQIWVTQSSNTYPFPSVAKFNGQIWTAAKAADTPFIFANNLTSGLNGNIYVLDNATPRTLYRYDGLAWKKTGEFPFTTYINQIQADSRGNIWFSNNSTLFRYGVCDGLAAPKVLVSNPKPELGESVTLRADGCSSTIWSWSSADGNVTDPLIKVSNELIVNPTVSTTYRTRCYNDGCSSTEDNLVVSVLPRLSIVRTNKTTYCPGDKVTATFSLQGSVDPSNQYSLVVRSGSQTTRYPATVSGADLSVPLSTTLIPGRYVVYAESSLPIVRSRDSLEIVVVSLPTAGLGSTKAALMPGDSARISIDLTGTAPWQFTRWDRQLIQTPVSLYTTTFKATQPQAYTLGISDLSDAACSTGIIKNTLTIGLTVLANEPAAARGLSIYPNPATDKLIIETAAPALIAGLQLSNSQGQRVKHKQLLVPVRRTEWDISDAPAGAYLLQITTADGQEVVWKVVKL